VNVPRADNPSDNSHHHNSNSSSCVRGYHAINDTQWTLDHCNRLAILDWEITQFSPALRSTVPHALWYTGWARKNVPLYFCPYLCQLLIDVQNSFTGTLWGQFAITWLLHIPPQRKCVFTLSCEISMKYAYITIITNKHFGKMKKKTLQTNIAVNDLYDTKVCGSNTV